MKMYKISESELKSLIEARAILDVMRDRDYDRHYEEQISNLY